MQKEPLKLNKQLMKEKYTRRHERHYFVNIAALSVITVLFFIVTRYPSSKLTAARCKLDNQVTKMLHNARLAGTFSVDPSRPQANCVLTAVSLETPNLQLIGSEDTYAYVMGLLITYCS